MSFHFNMGVFIYLLCLHFILQCDIIRLSMIFHTTNYNRRTIKCKKNGKVVEAKGNYKISNFGRIENVNGISFGREDSIGYMRTSVDNKNKSIHQLVAIHFIPNPENKSDVNHIDCNKQNNHIDNLEWVTKKENSIKLSESGGHSSNNRITEQTVHEIKALLRTKWYSHRQIADIYGVTRPCITFIANGNRWKNVI